MGNVRQRRDWECIDVPSHLSIVSSIDFMNDSESSQKNNRKMQNQMVIVAFKETLETFLIKNVSIVLNPIWKNWMLKQKF